MMKNRKIQVKRRPEELTPTTIREREIAHKLQQEIEQHKKWAETLHAENTALREEILVLKSQLEVSKYITVYATKSNDSAAAGDISTTRPELIEWTGEPM